MVSVPKVLIEDPLAATNGDEVGVPLEVFEGKTDTSAPVSTRKSFPVLRSRSERARGDGEETEVRWLMEELPGATGPRRGLFPALYRLSS